MCVCVMYGLEVAQWKFQPVLSFLGVYIDIAVVYEWNVLYRMACFTCLRSTDG